ncbi:Wd40 repeat protein, partial [Globisporangium splendens]
MPMPLGLSMHHRLHQPHHYAPDSLGISALLAERELRGNGRAIDIACQDHGSLVTRLACDAVLDGHHGCVNHLRWNRPGSLLVSGSDDQHVIVWDYATRKQHENIATGHTGNIFAVCFVPETNDHIIASVAADYDVRIHYAPFRSPDSTKLFRVHGGRVKDIGTSWGVPKVFWSVAEDGLVYQFDVRALPTVDGRGETHDSSGVLVRLGRDRRGKTLRGMGMATHPLDPTKFVLACGDHYTRLYDRRMLRIQKLVSRREASQGATIPTEIFAPPHLHLNTSSDRQATFRDDEAHGTSIQFSNDGSEILANYHNDHIYLFNVNGGPHPVNQYEKKEESSVTTAEVPGWHNGQHMDESSIPLLMRSEEVKEVHSKGLVALFGLNFTRALKFFLKACNAKCLPTLSAPFRKDLYHNCAKAYLGRGWSADYYLAAVYCKKALELDADDRDVDLTYIKALHSDKKNKHARYLSAAYRSKYPEFASDVDQFADDGNADRTTSPRSPLSASHSSDDGDEDDDDEPRRSEDEHSDGSRALPVSPRIAGPENDDEFWKASLLNGQSVSCDVVRRYIGYCNSETDIKEAAFMGQNDAYIVAGSDDGRAYIWEKATGKLVNAIVADESIVNCVRPHPIDSCLATSGIEDVIRLWSPTGDPGLPPTEDELDDMTKANQSKMSDNNFGFYFRSATPNVIRVVFQSGSPEGIRECATS